MRVIKQPYRIVWFVGAHNILPLPDAFYLKIAFKCLTNQKLDLDSPRTFNEKLQWLKIHDRKDVYTTMVDKYEAKKYVANIIGEEYIIPTYGIYDRFDSINFDKLPNQFVIKCTHDSGGLVICRDKSLFNKQKAKKLINKHLRKNYYWRCREWPYKNVKPRIIIEKYMEDDSNRTMKDYKFFCFNGNAKLMYLSEGLEDHSTAGISFYDMDFNEAEFWRADYKKFDKKPKKPFNFEKMKEIAKVLSKATL